MAKRVFESVSDYLGSLSREERDTLSKLRATILKAVPKVTESIRYNLPFYEYEGMLCSFAAQKNYLSFYVLNGEVVKRNKELLAGLSVGKGCIRFRKIEELPSKVVVKLLKDAAKDNEQNPNNHC